METVYEPVNADSTFKRSTRTRSVRWTSDVRHGSFVPCRVFEVLPSDQWRCDLRHYTRMNTPIAPVFGDIFQHWVAFFVPKRIIFDKTKQFYGEAESYGIATEISEPTSAINGTYLVRADNDGPESWDTIGNHFGLVVDSVPTISKRIPINVLPIRAYLACYNEYVRNENYQPKYLWDKSAYGSVSSGFATLGLETILAGSALPKVNKDPDIFTTILPYALKSSDPVTLPISGEAEVSGDINTSILSNGTFLFQGTAPTSHGSAFLFAGDTIEPDNGPYAILGSRTGTEISDGEELAYGGGLKTSTTHDLTADLSTAVSASLSSLIYALSYQYFLSKLAKGGSKYGEYLEIMFGAKCPAATRDEPEFLGHVSYQLNIDTVVQTTDYASGSTSKLGAVGANSQTGGRGSFFNGAFTEPGYLVICTYFKHKRVYGNSIDAIMLKKDLLDYYQTPFANMPDVSMNSELMFFTGDNTKAHSLGFVEPYLEYDNFADVVRGGLNPNNPNSFDYWTLAEAYEECPVINGDFLKENRDNIARALVSGVSGSDYICDAIFDLKISRVKPLYSTGLGKI